MKYSPVDLEVMRNCLLRQYSSLKKEVNDTKIVDSRVQMKNSMKELMGRANLIDQEIFFLATRFVGEKMKQMNDANAKNTQNKEDRIPS